MPWSSRGSEVGAALNGGNKRRYRRPVLVTALVSLVCLCIGAVAVVLAMPYAPPIEAVSSREEALALPDDTELVVVAPPSRDVIASLPSARLRHLLIKGDFEPDGAGSLGLARFGQLRILTIESCKNLPANFGAELAACRRLETLTVSGCGTLGLVQVVEQAAMTTATSVTFETDKSVSMEEREAVKHATMTVVVHAPE